MPVNVIDPSHHSFVNQVTPVLQGRNIGLLAMKTLADGRFFAQKKRLERIQWTTEDPAIPARLSIRDALHFAWSQPITVLITGAENASLLVREKVDLARSYEGMSDTDQVDLIARAADWPMTADATSARWNPQYQMAGMRWFRAAIRVSPFQGISRTRTCAPPAY